MTWTAPPAATLLLASRRGRSAKLAGADDHSRCAIPRLVRSLATLASRQALGDFLSLASGARDSGASRPNWIRDWRRSVASTSARGAWLAQLASWRSARPPSLTWTAPPAATLALDRAAGAQRSWLELTEAQQGSLSGGIGWVG